MESERAALAVFFRAAQFAVVGANSDRTRWGNKVLRWYQEHNLPVTPVHPRETRIEGLVAVRELKSVLDQAATPHDARTAVSVITPPSVSLALLREYASDPRIVAMWLQPGAADASVVEWLRKQPADVQDRIIWSGPCVLVQGVQLARANGRM
ncbi:hypothetical protein MCUN1_002486 [Malassezia cuniculi]|uniref:CoA-binding domain-containing protein n=1 Tax=Malassezia cuniculi TaxID=948313 RepID=A0AAF0ERL3_9BASI|nr:hypothetical protein MCUN1_002486 [Malassezia cuniculi]